MYKLDQAKKVVTQYCSGTNDLCPCDPSLGPALTQPGSGSLGYIALDTIGGGTMNEQMASVYKESNPLLSSLINSMSQSSGSSTGGGGGSQAVLQGILSTLSKPTPQSSDNIKALINTAMSSASIQQVGTSLQQMQAKKMQDTMESTAKAVGIAAGTVGKNVAQASIQGLTNAAAERFQSFFSPPIPLDSTP
jgi:hypothetical protein